MTDFLIHTTLSNLALAFVLAVVALVVQQRVRSPAVSHILWALVLLKLLLPPIFSIPVLGIPAIFSQDVSQADEISALIPPIIQQTKPASGNSVFPSMSSPALDATARNSDFSGTVTLVINVLFFLWLGVSGSIGINSAIRIIRFHKSLSAAARIHEELTDNLSDQVAKHLGMRVRPNILVVQADIAPFVWWMSGRSVIVLPACAVEGLSHRDLRLIIYHEMAHIKRRDPWLRWVEWIAIIFMWWNPLMWWARSQLRVSEELACDDVVLESAPANPSQYGHALLSMAELLTSTAIRPPVVASSFNSGGILEQRIKMMILTKSQKTSKSLRLTIVGFATCLFPFGIVYSQDLKAVKLRLNGAIEAGELSQDQAELMLDALRNASGIARQEALQQKLVEVKKDLKAAIEAGKISEEDAEVKLKAARREMFERSEGHNKEAVERVLAGFKKELLLATKSGEISKDDAAGIFERARHEMLKPNDDHGDKEAIKRRLARIKEDLKKSFGSGKRTSDDAEPKRDDVFRESTEKVAHSDKEFVEMLLSGFKKELNQVAASDKLSSAVIGKMLDHVRREMFVPNDDHGNRDAMERRFMRIKRELKEAVEAGDFLN